MTWVANVLSITVYVVKRVPWGPLWVPHMTVFMLPAPFQFATAPRTKSWGCERNKGVLILVIYLPSPYLHMGSGLQMKEVWSGFFLGAHQKKSLTKNISPSGPTSEWNSQVSVGTKTSSAQPEMSSGKGHTKPGWAFQSLLPIKLHSTTLQFFYRLSYVVSCFSVLKLSL